MRTRRSLLDLDDLGTEEFEEIFARTAAFESKPPERRLAGIACVNIFFEPSTRTFTSFNLAELRLGADVVNLTPTDLSYLHKGETIEDTIVTLSAMGIGVLVVRKLRWRSRRAGSEVRSRSRLEIGVTIAQLGSLSLRCT